MSHKTVYACDGCDQQMPPDALRVFKVIEAEMGGDIVATALTDLCTDCERKLHEVALPLFPDAEAERLRGIVR